MNRNFNNLRSLDSENYFVFDINENNRLLNSHGEIMKTFLRFLMLTVLVISFSNVTKAQVKSLSEFSELTEIQKSELRKELTQQSLKKKTPVIVTISALPAGVTYYDNRATFTAMYPGLTSEDFSEADSRIGISGSDVVGFPINSSTNNRYFHTNDIANGLGITIIDPYFGSESDMWVGGPHLINWMRYALGNEHTILGADYFIDNTALTFSPAANYVGFDLYPFYDEGYTDVSLYDASGKLIHTTKAMSTYAGSFFGVRSSSIPISLIILHKETDYYEYGDGEQVGNIVFGSKISADIPVLANMEEDGLYYGNKTNIKKITDETTANGPSTCTSAVIKVAENYSRGKDILMLNPGTGLRSSFNVATGTLTVSGYAPTSVYQNVIRNIIYLYFSSTKIPYETDYRRVDFTLYNGSYASNTVSRYIYFDPRRPEKSVQEEVAATQLPTEFSLYQNYPNPFNPVTNIRFALPQEGFTTLKVYNMLGQEVANLMNEDLVAGTYEVQFDGTKLASGTYIYRLTSGNYMETKKFILMK
jgi:hypothetical protein